MVDVGEEALLEAACGMMTTDTVHKVAGRTVGLSGGAVQITGMAKGAAMIGPSMATMLAVIATDARIDAATAQQSLRTAVDDSFNCISVDSDTSTNDACLLVATGEGPRIAGEESIAVFRDALDRLTRELAQAIIRDGEGATKFVTLDVQGARSRDEALNVAFTVAHSPLVKTALYASDANWGRILAAVGRAPVEDFDVERVAIDLGEVRLVEAGERVPGYTEKAGSAVMTRDEIDIRIHLGRGEASATVWTSDLSHDYVSINADYRS